MFHLALFAAICWSGSLVFARIGEPGWLFLVPGFNTLAVARRAGLSLWIAPLCFASLIPWPPTLCWLALLAWPASLVLYTKFVRALGRPAWLGVGVATLPFVFLPVLA